MTAYALTDTVGVNNFPAVQVVTGTVTCANITLTGTVIFPSTMVVTGTVRSVPDRPSSGAVTVFTASMVNTTVLQTNSLRLGAMFTNDDSSAGNCYLKFGANAAVNSYSSKLHPGAYLELPFSYYGRIDCIWDTVPSGTLLVTELT